ncbi:MAG: acyltransferase [Chitinophagales bacterium]
MSKGWIGELDLLRGVAFLGVALQHVIGAFIRHPDISIQAALTMGLLFNITKFAVPAFVFVSGLVMVYRYYPRASYGPFLIKRFKDVAVPYVLWTLIYIVYFSYISTGKLTVGWWESLYKLITGTGCYHLWFIVLIIQFYLLLPLFLALFRWIDKDEIRAIRTLAVLGAIYLALTWLSYFFVTRHAAAVDSHWIQLAIKFRDRNVLLWFLYFIGGGSAGMFLFKWRKWVRNSWAWSLVLWVASLVWVCWELWSGVNGNVVNLNISTSLKPSMVVFTCVSLVLVYNLSLGWAKIDNGIVKLVQSLGQYSLGAYFVHALALSLLIPFIGTVWPQFRSFSILSMFLVFGLCVLLSLAFAALVSRIPGGHWLVGESRAGRK